MPDVTFPNGNTVALQGWQEVFGLPGRVTLAMLPLPESAEQYAERFVLLRNVANIQNMGLAPVGIGDLPFAEFPAYTQWTLNPSQAYWESDRAVLNAYCYYCGNVFGGGDNCMRCGRSTQCQECGVTGCGLAYAPDLTRYVCVNCMPECVDCHERPGTYAEGFCERCWGEQTTCGNCGTRCTGESFYMDEYGDVCPDCYDQRCRNCESRFQEYGEYCYRCEDNMQDEQLDYEEDFDYGIEDFTPLEFSFDRGRQRTSVEIEFGGDPGSVAQTLYQRELSPVRSVGDYHSGMGRENNECAYVEYDGSLSEGGELIISRLGLPEQTETRRLWQTLAVLRKHVRDGHNSLNMQCGVHIHVDVGKYDLPWAMSAAVTYNFLEKVLYHIASANWSSHRSVRGNDYSKLTPKMVDNPARFREVFGYDRYYGLNASNYLSATQRCECGNRETLSQCSCRRYKATLEFRLWNTTVNPRKLHAYIAICQAITAFGRDKELTVSDLPAWEFDNTRKPTADDAHEYAKRLVWMFENLPFSPEERNSIRYCLRHCDLAQVLENSDVDQNVVHGILHDDELLSIPEFIAPREDEDQGRVTIPASAIPRFQSEHPFDRFPVRQDANGRWHDAQGRYTYTPEGETATTSLPADWEQAIAYAFTYAPPAPDFAQEYGVVIDF